MSRRWKKTGRSVTLIEQYRSSRTVSPTGGSLRRDISRTGRMAKRAGKAGQGPEKILEELREIRPEAETEVGKRAGFVAVVGLPNAGKSTLVNALVGEKVSAVSPTPQTTRTLIRGILNESRGQIVFLDTPGFHTSGPLLNQRMGERLREALEEAHVILWVADMSSRKRDRDWERFQGFMASGRTRKPLVVALTKMDRLGPSNMIPVLLEFEKEMARNGVEGEIVPISGLKEMNLDPLKELLFRHLPEGEPIFDPEWYTSQTMREMVREIVQEKIFSLLYQEVPHQCAVLVEEFQEPEGSEKTTRIEGSILVERDSQKGIVVGARGETIRTISERARKEIEALTGTPVFLRLTVRVVPDWRDRPSVLRDLGYLSE